MQLRCPSRIHGVLITDERIEVKCHSKHCGSEKGVTILHYFDLTTGELLDTKKFKEPESLFHPKKGKA